jgi:hypothetical protein
MGSTLLASLESGLVDSPPLPLHDPSKIGGSAGWSAVLPRAVLVVCLERRRHQAGGDLMPSCAQSNGLHFRGERVHPTTSSGGNGREVAC